VGLLGTRPSYELMMDCDSQVGVPKFAASQDLPDVDCAGFAARLGLAAIEIRHAEEIGPAWEKALAADRPTVLDVHTDPDVPPIPPHATLQQMRDAARAMIGGDENAWGVLKTGIRQKAQEFLPGTKDA
jgi:pyruvate dehydrogenase (quinone)